jgi:hypothetical protein
LDFEAQQCASLLGNFAKQDMKMSTLKDYHLKSCHCGSGLERHARFDARGIFLTYVCDKCEKEKLKRYRPEVLTDPNYDTFDDVVDED